MSRQAECNNYSFVFQCQKCDSEYVTCLSCPWTSSYWACHEAHHGDRSMWKRRLLTSWRLGSRKRLQKLRAKLWSPKPIPSDTLPPTRLHLLVVLLPMGHWGPFLFFKPPQSVPRSLTLCIMSGCESLYLFPSASGGSFSDAGWSMSIAESHEESF